MPIYTPGRRRAMLLLLLTSALLLTMDLRGTAILDTVRNGFRKAIEPFEAAADVVTTPIRNAWRGIMDYEELERENHALQEEVDGQRADQVAGAAALQAYQELLALNDLSSLTDYSTVIAAVEGENPGNLDQIIEINKGRDDGLDIGMPVLVPGGLIGKVTAPLLSDRGFVMLITDPSYQLEVKVVAPPPPPTTTTAPVNGTTSTSEPAGGASTTTTDGPPSAGSSTSDSTTTSSSSSTSSTTTSTTTSTTSSTIPQSTEPGETTTSTAPPTTLPPTTTTDPQRETGRMFGNGPDSFPQVDFLQDTPTFGEILPGDIVLTAGGSTGLAPPDIPIGIVENVIQRSTAQGPLVEVAPLARLEELQFVTIVLYKPSGEVEPPIDTQAGD